MFRLFNLLKTLQNIQLLMKIITFGDNEEKMNFLKKSAERYKVDIEYIYDNNITNWSYSNFYDKLKTILKLLEILDDDMIVCIIDAYDLLVNKSIDGLENAFMNYDCDVLFGCEVNAFPEYIKPICEVSTNYKYVNGGGYIGYVKAIKNIYKHVSDTQLLKICTLGTDQLFFNTYYNEFTNVKIDYKCIIFQNMFGLELSDFEYKDYTLYNNVMKTIPFFIHFNGASYIIRNKKSKLKENALNLFTENSVVDLNKYESKLKNKSLIKKQIT